MNSFADEALENDLVGAPYINPDYRVREHLGHVEEHELERLRNMRADMLHQPEDFHTG